MGAKGSAGFTISSSSYISAENRWSVGGTIQGSTGLDATSFGVDDIIYDYSTTYGKRR